MSTVATPRASQAQTEPLAPIGLAVLSALPLAACGGGEAGAPQLVIWCLGAPPDSAALLRELRRLQERWQPAPLLLLLPAAPPYPPNLQCY